MGKAKILGSGSNAPKNATVVEGYALFGDIPANIFVKQADRDNIADNHATVNGNLFMINDTVGFIVEWTEKSTLYSSYKYRDLKITPFKLDYTQEDNLTYGTTVQVANDVLCGYDGEDVFYNSLTENTGILIFTSIENLRSSSDGYTGNYILNTANIGISDSLVMSIGTQKKITINTYVDPQSTYRVARMGDNGSIMASYSETYSTAIGVGGAYFTGSEYIAVSAADTDTSVQPRYFSNFFIGDNYGMVFAASDTVLIYEMTNSKIKYLKSETMSNAGKAAYAIINNVPSFIGSYNGTPTLTKINSDVTFTTIQLEPSGIAYSRVGQYCVDDNAVYAISSEAPYMFYRLVYTLDNKVIVKSLGNKSFNSNFGREFYGIKKSIAYYFGTSLRYIEKVQRMGKTYVVSDDATINGITKSKLSALTLGKVYVVSNADTQLLNGIPVATVNSIKDTAVDEIKNAVISGKENENGIL